MSQAQIAGGTVTAQNELPSKAHRLREFELISALGSTIHLSDYRGRANLVLVVGGGPETAELLSAIASQYVRIKNEDAEVLAIMRLSREQVAETVERLKLPYPTLPDEDGRIHRELGAVDKKGDDAAAVYVTDRFGEVFGIYRTCEGQALPKFADILKWLEFVNAQCPECEPPEWPL